MSWNVLQSPTDEQLPAGIGRRWLRAMFLYTGDNVLVFMPVNKLWANLMRVFAVFM